MVSVDGLLDAHEVAVRARIEELRGQLADAERDLEHVVITRNTLRVVVAKGAAVVRPVKGVEGAGSDQVPVAVSGPGPKVVPLRGEGMTEQVLPAGYRRMWLAVRSASAGVRAGELARVLGLPAANSAREGLRGKLKRLVARGWAVEAAPGLFHAV